MFGTHGPCHRESSCGSFKVYSILVWQEQDLLHPPPTLLKPESFRALLFLRYCFGSTTTKMAADAITPTTTTKQQDTSGSASLSTTESLQEKPISKDAPPLTPGEWKRLRWRLDLRIVLLFALLYMWSAMDRSNIGKLGF